MYCLEKWKSMLIGITHEDNERLQNDLDEIVSNNVDHWNEIYHLLNLKKVLEFYRSYFDHGDLREMMDCIFFIKKRTRTHVDYVELYHHCLMHHVDSHGRFARIMDVYFHHRSMLGALIVLNLEFLNLDLNSIQHLVHENRRMFLTWWENLNMHFVIRRFFFFLLS